MPIKTLKRTFFFFFRYLDICLVLGKCYLYDLFFFLNNVIAMYFLNKGCGKKNQSFIRSFKNTHGCIEEMLKPNFIRNIPVNILSPYQSVCK